MTIAALIAEASTRISRRDAELLLAQTLGSPRTFLLAHPDHIPSPAQRAAFEALVVRRASGAPLQYLTGVQEFFGLEFRVSPAVLIPRPETEHLVEAVLAWARCEVKPLRILDVGTGSGAIAIAIATHEPGCEIIATDISSTALALARENARRLQVGDRVQFQQSDLLADILPTLAFDAIVSNPPYVPETDRATLQREVIDHEPHTALFAGADGLGIYRRLIPQALAALRPGGLLALELGFGQSNALHELLGGWQDVRFLNDYAGIPRVALALKP